MSGETAIDPLTAADEEFQREVDATKAELAEQKAELAELEPEPEPDEPEELSADDAAALISALAAYRAAIGEGYHDQDIKAFLDANVLALMRPFIP